MKLESQLGKLADFHNYTPNSYGENQVKTFNRERDGLKKIVRSASLIRTAGYFRQYQAGTDLHKIHDDATNCFENLRIVFFTV
jgi:hypothetical protein